MQQLSDALAHAGNAKHAAEALARNEAFLSQEVGLKEVGILNNKADALVHEVQNLASCGWQQVVHEVVNVGLQVLQGQGEVRGSKCKRRHPWEGRCSSLRRCTRQG